MFTTQNIFKENNGKQGWKDNIDKEMKNIASDVDIIYRGKPTPIVWTWSSGHLVFSVKMDFTQKDR